MSIKAWRVLPVILGVYAAVSFFAGALGALKSGRSQDLGAPYEAARLWLHRADPYRAYSHAEWMARTGARYVADFDVVRVYSTLYPPIALIDLAPISGVEWESARRLWLGLNVALAAFVPWMVRRLWFRHWTTSEMAVFTAIWFGGMSLRIGIGNGQHALFSFACLLLGIWLLRAGRDRSSGVAFALSLHKYTLSVLFLPLLVTARRFVSLGMLALTTLLLVAIFFVWIDVPVTDVVRSYLAELGWWYRGSEMGDLAGLGATHVFPLIRAGLGQGVTARVAMLGLAGASALAVWWPRGSGPDQFDAVDVAPAVLLTLLASYHGLYDAVVLIVPIAVLMTRWRRSETARGRWGWGLLFVASAGVWYGDAGTAQRVFAWTAPAVAASHSIAPAAGLAFRAILAVVFVGVLLVRFGRPTALNTHVHPRHQRVSR